MEALVVDEPPPEYVVTRPVSTSLGYIGDQRLTNHDVPKRTPARTTSSDSAVSFTPPGFSSPSFSSSFKSQNRSGRSFSPLSFSPASFSSPTFSSPY